MTVWFVCVVWTSGPIIPAKPCIICSAVIAVATRPTHGDEKGSSASLHHAKRKVRAGAHFLLRLAKRLHASPASESDAQTRGAHISVAVGGNASCTHTHGASPKSESRISDQTPSKPAHVKPVGAAFEATLEKSADTGRCLANSFNEG